MDKKPNKKARYIYFPDDIQKRVSDMAERERRAFSQMVIVLVENGLIGWGKKDHVQP